MAPQEDMVGTHRAFKISVDTSQSRMGEDQILEAHMAANLMDLEEEISVIQEGVEILGATSYRAAGHQDGKHRQARTGVTHIKGSTRTARDSLLAMAAEAGVTMIIPIKFLLSIMLD